jgi:erythromycin esterase
MYLIKKVMVLILILFLFVPTVSLVLGQNEIEIDGYNPSLRPSRIISPLTLPAIISLNNIIHPLNSTPLELSDENLEVLDYMSDCKVVGLGEETHGTKEFFQLKHRIFRYLVENHGFKTFAFECDMGESYYIDNFVVNGEGDIGYIMKNIMHFWTWRTEEVKDLLIWMKDYNEYKSNENKIHFIGVDCQYMTYQSDIIIDYFNKTNVSLSEDCLEFLYEIYNIGQSIYDYYSEITLDKKEEIDHNVDILLTTFEELRDELTSNSSNFEYQFIKQIVLNIKQTNDVRYGYVHGAQENYRDLYMAENTLWTSDDLFGKNTKVALWAHNAHVSNSSTMGSIGFHLKEALKEKYQILGFSFSLGSFTAIRMGATRSIVSAFTPIKIWTTKHGSINYVFHHAQHDNFILRSLDIQEKSDFDTFISQPQSFLNIGAGFNRFLHILGFYYYPTKLMEEYDVVIHWDKTEAAEQIN